MEISQSIYYILFILFIIILIRSLSYTPEYKIYRNGFGHIREDIGTLLDRIEWANSYKGRINYKLRFLILSLIVCSLVLMISKETKLDIRTYIQCVLVVFVILFGIHGYSQHHGEKFGHYAVEKNIKLLRKKLNIKKGEIKPVNEKLLNTLVLPSSNAWNFTFT